MFPENLQKNIIFKIILYVCCAGMAAFYLYVFYLGFHPQVSDDYRAYYIDQTVDERPGETMER